MQFIKFKDPGVGTRAWWFVKGGRSEDGTRLRIHAAQFKDEEVEAIVEQLRKSNPGIQFKAVSV